MAKMGRNIETIADANVGGHGTVLVTKKSHNYLLTKDSKSMVNEGLRIELTFSWEWYGMK